MIEDDDSWYYDLWCIMMYYVAGGSAFKLKIWADHGIMDTFCWCSSSPNWLQMSIWFRSCPFSWRVRHMWHSPLCQDTAPEVQGAACVTAAMLAIEQVKQACDPAIGGCFAVCNKTIVRLGTKHHTLYIFHAYHTHTHTHISHIYSIYIYIIRIYIYIIKYR